MSRYGYQDMPEGYTDIGYWHIMAICCHCGHEVDAIREDCWTTESGQLITDCMCCELPDAAENADLVSFMYSSIYTA